MLSSIASSITGLLKLLTPKEVSRIAKSNDGVGGPGEVGNAGIGSIQIGFEGSGNINANDGKGSSKAELLPLKSEEDAGLLENVIPIRQVEGEPQGEPQAFAPPDLQEDDDIDESLFDDENDLEKAGILSASKLERQRHKRIQERKKKELSSSMFLLTERDKLKGSRAKSIYKSAINNYESQKNSDGSASADAGSSATGVLVDKKLA